MTAASEPRPRRDGVFLINLGTPDSPEVGDVRRYLREFLSDPLVLDINPAARAALLNLIILPLRSPRSAKAYRKIWTDAGSPLLTHTEDLAAGVAERLGEDTPVVVGMRYGNPSIVDGLKRLIEAGVDSVVVLPLFPQYSQAAWHSAAAKVQTELAKLQVNMPIQVVPPFWDDAGFIEAWAQVARPELDSFGPDRVLISFHGIPERHVKQTDPSGQHCLASEGCCDAVVPANRFCYRAQCYDTARRLAAALNLADDTWEVSFQSRLGREPWLQPFTDKRVEAMPGEGVKRLAVMSPAFVADCLETLEELAMEAREEFIEAGGEDLHLVPSLNSHPAWADAVAAMVSRHRLAPAAR